MSAVSKPYKACLFCLLVDIKVYSVLWNGMPESRAESEANYDI